MQRQESTTDSVPKNVVINLGTFSVTDSMTWQTLSSGPNQEGICSSSCTPSTESSPSSHEDGNGSESFNAWNFGQLSFAANWESQPNFDGMEVEQGWSPPTCTSTGVCPSSAARQLGLHHNVLVHETAVSQNQDDNLVHHNNANAGPSISSFLNLEPVDGISNVARFRSSVCSSGSSSHMDGRTEGSSSSLAAWDSLSSKRKALEGTSGQLNHSASSSGILQAENFTWPNEAPHCDSPHPVNFSQLSSWSSHNDNFLGNFSASNVIRVRGTTLDPRGSVDGGGSLGPQQEPFPSNLSTSTLSSFRNSRHSSGLSPSHWPGLSSSFLDVRSTRDDLANAGVSQITQSNAIQTPQLPRNISGYPWIGSQHSRSSNFTCSVLPGGSPDEVNSGSMLSYNSENPVASSAAQTRSIMQDPPSWDIAAGLTSHNLNSLPFSHRTGRGSSSHPLRSPFRTPCHMSREIRRVLELAPWTPESFDSQNNYLLGPLSSSGSSSSQQGSGGNSLCRSQQYHRPGFSVDREGGELLAMSESPLQAFTGDVERRNRVIAEIRQVLNAMNRGDNLRAEDCMLFEPLMFQGLAEIHDQHRDMRLDVDNMSYEELLELEERIGDVSTGLKEETIMKFLKQNKKEIPTGTESVNGLEPCCICQEQYVGGEGTGELDCGHDFHVDCIKQWLMHKNRCPICKTTGLVT